MRLPLLQPPPPHLCADLLLVWSGLASDFFRRSALANSEGYYDGCAQVHLSVYHAAPYIPTSSSLTWPHMAPPKTPQQVLKDCDFKSVTRTGTGGIIVVSPSTDKDWVRAPWDVALTEISDALLKAVARPAEAYSSSAGAAAEELSGPAGCAEEPLGTACAPATVAAPAGADADADAVLLSFEGNDDGDLVLSGARAGLVRKMDYVSALLSGRWRVESTKNDMPTLQMPCQRAVFEEILCLLEKGEISNERPPTVELLHAIEQTVDMLGAPKRTQHPLLERATFWADLYQVCPDWWLESSEEQARMLGCSGADSDAALERITDELAQCLGYEPAHPKNSLWLFQELPHSVDPDRGFNLKVLMDHPSEKLRAQLPEAVTSLLRLLPTCLAVAGGAVLGSVSRWAEWGSDVKTRNRTIRPLPSICP